MKIVSTSYINTPEYTDPVAWLQRIDFHTIVLEQLAKRHEITSIEQINYEGELKKNGVYYYFYNSRTRKLVFPLKLHRYIKKKNPDVIIVNGLIFPFQLIQLKWMIKRPTKIIALHHAEKPFKGAKVFFQKIADRFIDAYLFSSAQTGMDWVHSGIIKDPEKIVEVMEASSTFKAMDRTKARMLTGVNGMPVYLWVGRLNANKDPLTVVKAFIRFGKSNPQARLYMIYQNEELLDEIKNLLPENNKSIILIGQITHDTLEAWYNSADFIISGSHYEGSGIAVCEAMSCGCIPVLTNINSFKTMTGGKCGLIYKKASADDLFATLLKTTSMDIGTEREKTIQQFRIELSAEAIAEKINLLIQKL